MRMPGWLHPLRMDPSGKPGEWGRGPGLDLDCGIDFIFGCLSSQMDKNI